jgi:hypothetical protein
MQPYGEDEALNNLYALLFCDDLELFREGAKAGTGPWQELFRSPPNIPALREIANDERQESRIRLLAFRKIEEIGEPVADRVLLGVVIEVGMDEGLDTLAVYRDGTARLINYSGKMVIWETRTEESDRLTSSVLDASENVVRSIGPWDGKRLPPPVTGQLRMSFLTSDGLYFGEGPFSAIAGDPIGGPVVTNATELMLFLIDRAKDQSP